MTTTSPKTIKKLAAGDPETQSADVVAENIARLKALFPELVTEGEKGASVNVDVLKQIVGDQTVTDAEEKFGLNWHGKRRFRQLALTPSTGTLRPCPEESVDWDTTQNLFIEGDNLETLKLLRKSYRNKVKLVYIDPPYNTGKDFVYPDDFRDGVANYKRLTGQLDEQGVKQTSNSESSGRFHTAWLNMMLPRIRLAHELLDKRGAICVSLDDTEVAHFRAIADEIFGGENFLATICWEKVHTRKNSAKTFSISHDYVVVYARDKSQWDRSLLPRENSNAYTNPDNDPKGPWKPDPVTAHNAYSADYKITKPNGVVLSRPEGRYWAFSETTWKTKVAANEVLWGDGNAYPMIKRYLSEVQDGLVPVTLFSRKFAGDTAAAKRESDLLFGEQGVFEYPKPTLLIRRLIEICTRPDELVLDFFAGSGTTAHAIWLENAKMGGERRFLLVQLPEPLDPDVSEQRVAANYCDKLGRPRNLAELTKERLRRSAKAIREDNSTYSGDLGFRVFKLDTSNIREWEPKRDDLDESLAEHIEHLRADRSEQDILYELLLKRGLDLCVPIETKEIAGKQVHSIGAGSLFACLAESISRNEGEDLALGIVAWHKELDPAGDTAIVFRDDAFADDVVKTNVAAILEQNDLKNVRSL